MVGPVRQLRTLTLPHTETISLSALLWPSTRIRRQSLSSRGSSDYAYESFRHHLQPTDWIKQFICAGLILRTRL